MTKFELGCVTGVAITGLVQDVMGLQWVTDNWIDSRVTIPVQVVALALVAWTYFRGGVDK